jgi:D-alanine-D-alanine ligase
MTTAKVTSVKISPARSDSSRAPSKTLPLDILVLAGGPGAEREVSLQSGRAVSEAFTRLGHRVRMSDIDPTDFSALDHLQAGLHANDIIFIALHGEFGEDGVLQAELDRRGLRYCGSGAAASRLAMDKADAKRCFEHAGIPTPPYEIVDAASLDGLASRLPVPAVVKPVACGSSVDTFIARSESELCSAATRLVASYKQALIERYIDGPELTVGILGDEALPVCEIRTRREFYDYQAKYVDDDTEYLFDLDLPSAMLRRVQELSREAHRALGCAVFSRVDWMVDSATLMPYVLEVNTIPGFTSHSLLPKAAARMGLSFDQLCQRIVDLSLR